MSNLLKECVEKHKDTILETERYIWNHPESGFREWNTTKYMASVFEKAGYDVKLAGNIPGFYADLDTGRPGPRIVIFGEMDSLIIPEHLAQVDGFVHACGHNAQCAALVGAELALKERGALDGMCGSIRFAAVPAEELIEIDYREELRNKGLIHYYSGKQEFMYRGYLDGCDMAFMIHAGTDKEPCFSVKDFIGFVAKTVFYKGVAAHAGGHPELGINALYAANIGLNAINSLRETFRDNDHIRVHPIITKGGTIVNSIPSAVVLQCQVCANSMENIYATNKKVNRALAAGALALGAQVMVEDRPGYAPFINDKNLKNVIFNCAGEIIGRDCLLEKSLNCGSTDMGDISCIMPAVQAEISGCCSNHHAADFFITDHYRVCVTSALIYAETIASLLENGAEKAREIIEQYCPPYQDKEAYFKTLDQVAADRDLVKYTESGAEINW